MAHNVRLKLGAKLKELRKKKGCTQEKLADLANIDYKYLQRIEGKNPPAVKIDTMAKLAKALDVSLEALVT